MTFLLPAATVTHMELLLSEMKFLVSESSCYLT